MQGSHVHCIFYPSSLPAVGMGSTHNAASHCTEENLQLYTCANSSHTYIHNCAFKCACCSAVCCVGAFVDVFVCVLMESLTEPCVPVMSHSVVLCVLIMHGTQSTV